MKFTMGHWDPSFGITENKIITEIRLSRFHLITNKMPQRPTLLTPLMQIEQALVLIFTYAINVLNALPLKKLTMPYFEEQKFCGLYDLPKTYCLSDVPGFPFETQFVITFNSIHLT